MIPDPRPVLKLGPVVPCPKPITPIQPKRKRFDKDMKDNDGDEHDSEGRLTDKEMYRAMLTMNVSRVSRVLDELD